MIFVELFTVNFLLYTLPRPLERGKKFLEIRNAIPSTIIIIIRFQNQERRQFVSGETNPNDSARREFDAPASDPQVSGSGRTCLETRTRTRGFGRPRLSGEGGETRLFRFGCSHAWRNSVTRHSWSNAP